MHDEQANPQNAVVSTVGEGWEQSTVGNGVIANEGPASSGNVGCGDDRFSLRLRQPREVRNWRLCLSCFPLSQQGAPRSSNSPSSFHRRRPNSFVMITANRVLHCNADTPEEMHHWITLLQRSKGDTRVDGQEFIIRGDHGLCVPECTEAARPITAIPHVTV